ncbi:hypothetical protein EJ110_NYTH31961 [Nymphaea thermarum]|nr:hypothetical protein EJ110_NYTH31961 [Nymphaea thermarum]
MEGYLHGEMNWIYHSSHLHALQLISSSDGHPKSRCCDEPTVTSLINMKGRSNPVYICRPCNFYIHKACAELVPFIRHPCHPCDACWKPASGFSYHCTHCSFDLHTHFAFLPPTIKQPTSHPHLLFLSFSSGISSYGCDLCRRKIAATAWFYYCQSGNFQAHTDCIDQARRGCPPPGAAEPWPVNGQPTAPAAGRPLNPLNGLTPANWHGQAMGAPGLSCMIVLTISMVKV